MQLLWIKSILSLTLFVQLFIFEIIRDARLKSPTFSFFLMVNLPFLTFDEAIILFFINCFSRARNGGMCVGIKISQF